MTCPSLKFIVSRLFDFLYLLEKKKKKKRSMRRRMIEKFRPLLRENWKILRKCAVVTLQVTHSSISQGGRRKEVRQVD